MTVRFRSILVVMLLLFLSCVPAFAVEFSADMVTESSMGNVDGRIYVKGSWMRTEMNMEQTQIVLNDKKSGRIIVIIPEQRSYMEMLEDDMGMEMGREFFDMDDLNDALAGKSDLRVEKLGTEKVNGYLCDKYRYDVGKATTTLWISRKLQHAVRTVAEAPYGKMITELRNIREGGVDDNLFRIPSGYQKMIMPTLDNCGDT